MKEYIIPAYPGFAVATYMEADEVEPAGFIYDPVVAWRIEVIEPGDEPWIKERTFGAPIPITVDDNGAADELRLLRLPDGQFVQPCDYCPCPLEVALREEAERFEARARARAKINAERSKKGGQQP